MPYLNGMKFPYTPAGKKRYQQIKKAIGTKNAINKLNSTIPGMYSPKGKKKLR